MTIKELAQLAGVSVSTVSKIMNNKDSGISAETRHHVLQLAKEYHYQPYASVMTPLVKTWIIGIIFRDMADINMMMSGMLSAANSRGYSVLLRESSGSSVQEKKNIASLINMHVDGVIWEPVSADSLLLSEEFEKAQIPHLVMNCDAPEAINIDLHQMGYLATETLVKKNHTEIACLLSPGTRTERFYQGYRQCLFDYNLPLNDSLVFQKGNEWIADKIARHMFSGIVVSHYSAALRLYKLIDTMHYSIPYDLSIISLKDESRTPADYPAVSTLTIPHKEFGRRTAEQLISIVEKKDSDIDFNIPFQLDNTCSLDIPYNMRLKSVISLGSINIDYYLNFEALPHTGKTVITSTSSEYPGGKCINEAVGAAMLGHNVSIIGSVGDDSEADFIYDLIKDYTIDAYGIKRSKGHKTGRAYIFVQRDGDSMISIMSGANNTVTAQDILDCERLFINAGYCLMQTEIPMEAIIKAGEIAKKHGLTTVLKPSTCGVLPEIVLRNTDIIVPNLDELNEICPGSKPMEEKAASLLGAGVKTVIVTLGASGCYIREEHTDCYLAAADFVSIDSSGAGDAFISALVSYLLYDYDMISAARIATYAAGYSTTRQGTTPALIDKNTLESYIRQREPGLLKS